MPEDDLFRLSPIGLDSPVSNCQVVTPGVELAFISRAVTVTEDATVECTFRQGGNQVTLTMLAGVVYPFRLDAVATVSAGTMHIYK